VISQNLARKIPHNYKANKIKLGSLLQPHLVSASENLMDVGPSMHEGGALKFANFEKVRVFSAT